MVPAHDWWIMRFHDQITEYCFKKKEGKYRHCILRKKWWFLNTRETNYHNKQKNFRGN